MKLLQFKITEIPEGKMHYEKIELNAKEIGLKIDGIEFVSPIECSVRLVRERNIVYASIEACVDIQLECRRCLELYQTRISTHFDYQYNKADNPRKLESASLDSIRARYYMGETLNLADDVRQALALEMPIWSLCSEDCKGLCPRCGQNLNEGPCHCEIDISSPDKSKKLAVLGELLENAKNENEV